MIKDNFRFLIVGAGRGGTSLLAGLLDYHPGLEVSFEYSSVAYLIGKELYYSGSELFHKRVTSFISSCKQEASQYPTVIWGNKITTEQILGLEDHNIVNPESRIDVLDMFFNNYLKNKAIIFILRDGRSCINSKIQRKNQSLKEACEKWKYSVKCYKFLKTYHSNNICIRFEHLLLHPQKTLTNICDFLKIPFQKEMLEGTNNEKILHKYRKNNFDLSKMNSIDFPDIHLKEIEDDLKYCGYL